MIRPALIALLSGVAALSGCMSTNSGALTQNSNPSIYSVNQPVVQRTDYVFDVAAGGGGLAPAEKERLAAWFDTLAIGYGDRISIDEGRYADPRARADIAAVAARHGMLLGDGAPVTAGYVESGSVRVVVSRSSASVPGCPAWDNQEIGGRITTSPNYGCASNSNLAAMIADPEDLVRGRSGDARHDARVAGKAVKTYRDTPATGAGALKSESSKGQ